IKRFPPFIRVYGAESHHRAIADCPPGHEHQTRGALFSLGCGPRTRETARGNRPGRSVSIVLARVMRTSRLPLLCGLLGGLLSLLRHGSSWNVAAQHFGLRICVPTGGLSDPPAHKM